MWSRNFLISGVASAVAVAALTICGLWLVIYVVASNIDPSWSAADIVQFCLPGLIVYPACWYALVFRYRDYSLNRTLGLVIATFGAVWLLVTVAMFLVGVLAVGHLTASAPPAGQWSNIPALAPVLYAKMTILGAIILILPYALIATPIAFLHRAALLRVFAPRPLPPVASPAP